MDKIIFGFSRPKTWKAFAWLIMVSYSVPYSHAYVKVWSEKYERYLIYQASSTMVNFMNTQTFDEHNLVVHEFEIPVSSQARNNVMKYAIDTCGKPYGVKEIMGLAWVRINHWLGRDIKNPFADKSTFFCSALVAEILQEQLKVKLPKSIDDMTPEDVYNLLKLNNFIEPIS